MLALTASLLAGGIANYCAGSGIIYMGGPLVKLIKLCAIGFCGFTI